MTDRCHDCDKPLALDGDRDHPTNCAHCYEVCWRAVHGDVCQWPPADWRARCLELHAALTSVCDPSGSDADHWRRVSVARGVLSKEGK